MSILFSNEIMNAIVTELSQADYSVQIITAYCKESTFKKLNSAISKSVSEKRLLIRFRMNDILAGSTDFDVIECALDNKWDVFIRFDLHAKTYIVDNKRGIVGSANATNSGFGIGGNGNMEMAAFVDIEKQDQDKIDRLFQDAIHVDNEILNNLRSQLKRVKTIEKTKHYSWDDTISRLFNPKVDTLFSHEMPDDFNLVPGEYFPFLDETYDGDITKLKASFLWCNAFLWLKTTLKESGGCLFFGELSSKLHDSLITDPKPYRKDVKKMLANLLLLIQKLEINEITIDKPNYSQRVTLNTDQ